MPSPSALITSHSSSNMSAAEVKATLSDPLVLLDMEIDATLLLASLSSALSQCTGGGVIHLALKMLAQ